MAGIQSLHASDPTFYRIDRSSASSTPPATTGSGIVYDYNRGNPGWQAKVDGFADNTKIGGQKTEDRRRMTVDRGRRDGLPRPAGLALRAAYGRLFASVQ